MSIEANVEGNETQTLKGKLVTIPEIDKTLKKEGYSADAKATGDRLDALTEQVGKVTTPKAEDIPYNNTTVKATLEELETKSKDAFSKSEGGMVEGTVMVRNADNGYGSVMKNNSATADYGTQMADVTKDGRTAKITVNATSNLLTFADSDSNIRDIHHEGVKMFGDYLGNGSNAERVIDTKGIGKLLLVYSTTSLCYVTPKGANVTHLDTGEMSWIDSAKVYYVDGKLTLHTNNEAFNTNGETYYYQVI